jgi:hypothetical protein
VCMVLVCGCSVFTPLPHDATTVEKYASVYGVLM